MLENVFAGLKAAQAALALQRRQQKDDALAAAAAAIDASRTAILDANAADVEKARAAGTKESLVDRLRLDDQRIGGIVDGIETVIRQDDPIGRVRRGWTLPDGLLIEECTVPLGVAAIIYESRPNVTADAFALAYKSGCAILLRGSSAALASNRAIVAAIKAGLEKGGGLPDAVALVETASGDHSDIDEILCARGNVDVVLPRGGHELIRRVVENARVPVIETGEGNCHIFADASAAEAVGGIEKAVDIIENAKAQKPGVCNAVETLLVHRDIAGVLMPALVRRFAGTVELRCDAESAAAIGSGAPSTLTLKDAAPSDWETEFLDYILAVKTVGSVGEAVDHINRYGTRHSEAIITNDQNAARAFCDRVDAACVYVNASTRFTDGGQFGFGAELGISTQKFHARGPMGLEALTTIKYRISGTGQIRQ